ncbi:hypothetical protein ACJMK2_011539 [Sinanodonta woodiana]|uniref:Protein N-terminal glutamine amidohydrolase n=1 Tax=Sinanodonta woodiana TaxID=1069815 RepID=A0ABD3V8F5_SINWO
MEPREKADEGENVSSNQGTDFNIPLIQDCVYTSCFCEENVWKLCEHVQQNCPEHQKNCFCVFISNLEKKIPLWCQKSSSEEDGLVIWDYHVIFVYKSKDKCIVYDMDTSLPFPCDIEEYLSKAIRSDAHIKKEFHRFFRVIPSEEFIRTFASDRSHMLNKEGKWIKEPPNYPCIQTKESTNNIQDFINMCPGTAYGTVMDLSDFTKKFH